MIEIVIQSKNEKVQSISVTGHANSDAYGKDLVCAAVSAVVTGAFNALNKKDFKLELNEGKAYLETLGTISKHDEAVIDTLVTQLLTIEESNKKFVKLSRKDTHL